MVWTLMYIKNNKSRVLLLFLCNKKARMLHALDFDVIGMEGIEPTTSGL